MCIICTKHRHSCVCYTSLIHMNLPTEIIHKQISILLITCFLAVTAIWGVLFSFGRSCLDLLPYCGGWDVIRLSAWFGVSGGAAPDLGLVCSVWWSLLGCLFWVWLGWLSGDEMTGYRVL